MLGLPGLAPSADGPAHAPDGPALAAAAGPDGKENLEEGNGAAAAGEAAGGKAAGITWLTMACLVLGAKDLCTGFAAGRPICSACRNICRPASKLVACLHCTP